jgi:hypothetical protein
MGMERHSHVVHELDGGEHGGDDEAVHAVGVDGEGEAPAAAQETVEVHVRDDVARGAAPGEPRDARHVRAHRDARLGRGPERGRRRHRQRRRVVALRDALEDSREGGHDARHVLGAAAALRQLLAVPGHGFLRPGLWPLGQSGAPHVLLGSWAGG